MSGFTAVVAIACNFWIYVTLLGNNTKISNLFLVLWFTSAGIGCLNTPKQDS